MNLIKILQPQLLFRLVVVPRPPQPFTILLLLLPKAVTNASGNGESALLIRCGTLRHNEGRTDMTTVTLIPVMGLVL